MSISFEDFKNIELITAKVVEVAEHPNVDRLWVLTVDIGDDKRKQIIAGIKNHYSREELTDKTIIIVNNLEPRPLRGIESQGMLLAAGPGDEDLWILQPDDGVKAGMQVK